MAGVTVLSLLRRRHEAAGGRPREAVVLSGGGSLGAAQVGALRALLSAGIRPDLYVGCSVGALNAAALAAAPGPDRLAEIEALWRGLSSRDVFGGGRATLATHLVRRDDHLYEPAALRALIRRAVPLADLADAAVPVHVVTTDLRAGRSCWWSAGDPVTVLSASACLPAVFPPVPLGGSLHVDGGVTEPVPVTRALDLGAARVWVIDVTGGALGRRDQRMTALDVLLQSFAISRAGLDRPVADRPGQRVVRLGGLGTDHHELRDFSRTAELIERGHAAMADLVARELAVVPQPRRAG